MRLEGPDFAPDKEQPVRVPYPHARHQPWNPLTLLVLSFLVSFPIASFMIAWNWKRMGMRRAFVRSLWILAAFITAAILFVLGLPTSLPRGASEAASRATLNLAFLLLGLHMTFTYASLWVQYVAYKRAGTDDDPRRKYASGLPWLQALAVCGLLTAGLVMVVLSSSVPRSGGSSRAAVARPTVTRGGTRTVPVQFLPTDRPTLRASRTPAPSSTPTPIRTPRAGAEGREGREEIVQEGREFWIVYEADQWYEVPYPAEDCADENNCLIILQSADDDGLVVRFAWRMADSGTTSAIAAEAIAQRREDEPELELIDPLSPYTVDRFHGGTFLREDRTIEMYAYWLLEDRLAVIELLWQSENPLTPEDQEQRLAEADALLNDLLLSFRILKL